MQNHTQTRVVAVEVVQHSTRQPDHSTNLQAWSRKHSANRTSPSSRLPPSIHISRSDNPTLMISEGRKKRRSAPLLPPGNQQKGRSVPFTLSAEPAYIPRNDSDEIYCAHEDCKTNSPTMESFVEWIQHWNAFHASKYPGESPSLYTGAQRNQSSPPSLTERTARDCSKHRLLSATERSQATNQLSPRRLGIPTYPPVDPPQSYCVLDSTPACLSSRNSESLTRPSPISDPIGRGVSPIAHRVVRQQEVKGNESQKSQGSGYSTQETDPRGVTYPDDDFFSYI